MDKIKSSRELAMEQTAHLAVSAEAAAEFELEKYIRAAAILAGSLLEGKATADRVAESIDRYPAAATEKARRAFLQAVVEGMNSENCEQALEALARYRADGESGRAVEAVRKARRRYLDNLAAARARAEQEGRDRLREQLKQAGISGSAVEGINLDRAGWWKESAEKIAAVFSGELEKLKQDLIQQA